MKRVCAQSALCIFSIWSTPVNALDFFETRAGWNITSTDNACAINMEYEGSGATQLWLFKYVDGSLVLSLDNTAWSADNGAEYEITYVLNGTEFGGANSVGIGDTKKRGFASPMTPDFEEHFRKGSTLSIYLGDVLVDKLSLSGSSMALNSLNRCLTIVKNDLAAEARDEAAIIQRKARLSHIPVDPFIDTRDRSKPYPNTDPGQWVSSAYYPARAIQEQRSGRVGFTVTVEKDGTVSKCIVESSSGYADLDEATCKAVERNATFRPARDEDGQPIVALWSNFINWILPNKNKE